MLVEIGPVSSESVQAWIAYATDMLVFLRDLPGQEISPIVLDAFGALLQEWRPIVEHGRRFRWSSEETPERAKYLLNVLFVAGTLIEREAASGKARLRPVAADEFHVVLVKEVLGALQRESQADADFAHEMRDLWDIARRD